MRRTVVAAVVSAWFGVACSMGGTTNSGGDDGVVPTTTTAPASPEVSVDRDMVAETRNTRTTVEEASINGTTYPTALVMAPLRYAVDRDWRVELDAGRDYRRFRGDLGIPDDQSSSTAYRVDIVLDNGPPVLSVEVRFGETKTIDLEVTNVLRLGIVLSPGSFGAIAVGNPRLVR
ncbi:MAG: NPCBM/NEW2 domain-containing protein [Actinobacteria bacterium]|nr:NPCBM/NEW2 domain-containing protein [Actinomycetota bacterium]